MNHRSLLALLFSLTASCLHAADRPNLVWLISEDNSTHYLKLYDDHGAETPRIAALAKHGVLFEHAFSNSPVCSVARTTLMTGCYGPRIGTHFHRKSVTVPMPNGLRMFPAYLREAGYYATNNSKKDYNAIEGEGVWDASSKKANWRQRAAGQPFFHMQSFGTTHESSLHFRNMNAPTKHDPDQQVVAPYHPDTPTFRYTNARYRDNMQKVDAQIGAVVDQLEEDGLLEDTFIFYFGDHGGVLPRGKGYAYESGLHVPLVVRIPANWKHLAKGATLGSRQQGFVSFIDFGPTLLNLAGVDVPTQVDGKPYLGKDVSMVELNKRDEAFGYADRFDEKSDFVRTLRKGNFEYIRNYQPFTFDGLQNNYRYIMLAYKEWRQLYHAGELNEQQRQFFEARPAEQLFNIELDPHEVHDIAKDPEYAHVLQDMRTRLANRVKALPDLSLYPESQLVNEAFDNPVEFGQRQQAHIAELVDVADLSLSPFGNVEAEIRSALTSDDPWKRYWAVIVCSSHGKAALPLAKMIQQIAAQDEENMVRVRAAEFLGLLSVSDPRETIMQTLASSKHAVEANLVMNSLVLLRDGKPGYKFELPPRDFTKPQPGKAELERRMLYLHGELKR